MSDEALPEWFVPDTAAVADVLRSADLARENSGKQQVVHYHAHGEPCVPDCGVRLPTFGAGALTL